MAYNFFGAVSLTGGGTGALDAIDGTSLKTGDGACVITSSGFYIFYLSASSGASESSPDVISPDANAGSKRWILQGSGIFYINDTDASNQLQLKWNEDDSLDRILNFKVNSGDRTLDLSENLTLADGYDLTITVEDAASSVVLDNINFEVENTDGTQRTIKITSAKAGNTTLTINEDLTIVDGSAAILHFSSTATLTVSGSVDAYNHKAAHITSGNDEIDGDKLDIDWNPTYSTPATSPSEADSVDNLTAHLYGIDQKLSVVSSSTHATSHDPEDGSDALDTAAPSEISTVVAGGVGTSHSFPRADHIHAINHAITDNHIVTIDSASAASGEYGKFTANGLESKSFAEVMGDLSATAATAFDMNSQRITSVLDPINSQDATTKAYVDSVAQGLNPHDDVACATTGNITLSGEQTLDGVLTSTSRVLVKSQTDPIENGIYVSASGAWTRATDMDADDEVAGSFIFIVGGTTLNSTGWVCTNEPETVDIDTDAITFAQFSSAGYIEAGTGLTKSGNTIGATGVLEDLNTMGTVATDNQFIVASGIGAFAYESSATVRATLDLEIGTDVLAEQTIGIADDNLLEVDGSPSDNEYAKFTANGLEGRTYANVRSDLNVEDGSEANNISDANATDLTDGGDTSLHYHIIDGDQLDIDWNPSYSTPATVPSEADSVNDLTAHLYGIDQQLSSIASSTHATSHETGGGDEVDGDKLDIDWTPTYYTPATASEADSVDNLTSHLKGIDTLAGAHTTRHITGGADEIDGDKLDIDWAPTYYTPATSPTEADSLDNLTAHLYGIDQELSSAGGGSSEGDMYQDLLGDSAYLNCTWDDFVGQTLASAASSTMDFNLVNSRYDFTVGEILQSIDLYDATLGITVSECMVSMDYTDSGSPTLEATADGTNWETVTNNTLHTFTDTGAVLKLRFTAGGTGVINSWAVLYNPDTGTAYGSSVRKYITFNYEGLAQDEDTIIDGFYFNNPVVIDKMTLIARVAPTGADLTVDLLKDGAEQTKIATLATTSTYELTTLGRAPYAITERFGLKIKSVGSTEPGQSLTAVVHYYDRS